MHHAVVALAIQMIVGFATGNWWAGAAFGVGLYMGREHAQAEYRWIERFGAGRRANMPWYGGFDVKVWTKKSVLDFMAPAVLTTAAAIAANTRYTF